MSFYLGSVAACEHVVERVPKLKSTISLERIQKMTAKSARDTNQIGNWTILKKSMSDCLHLSRTLEHNLLKELILYRNMKKKRLLKWLVLRQ